MDRVTGYPRSFYRGVIPGPPKSLAVQRSPAFVSVHNEELVFS